MNVLILVLSARRHPWGSLMDAQRETWDAEDNPQTQTLFYCGRSHSESTDKVFYSPSFTEDLEQIASRTIEAFEKSLELEWDYMARPHSSTYVHKKNLVYFCQSLPKEDVVCGCMTTGDKPFIWGGCHYLFSRDVIYRIVESKDTWNHNVMEDGSITQIVNQLKIPVTRGHSATINMQKDGYTVDLYGHGENFSFTDWQDINKANGHFFFRCKQDLRREEDVRIFHELKAHLK